MATSTSSTTRTALLLTTGIGLAAVLALSANSAASAATVVDGPVNLGTAQTYSVLGASTVTNTGPTTIGGDLGLSPGTSITGFGGTTNGSVKGTIHRTDAAALQAQRDTTTAYNVAASLTPTRKGLSELNGLSLTPGVYTGGALALSTGGALTLAGTADSVWVFQAASTLTIGSASQIVITGGASACNVFWQVGSSATIDTAARFQGTVLADQSVTAKTSASIVGRLLARTGAVTLDTNTLTAPSGCPAAGTSSTSPTITSSAPAGGTVGTPYKQTVTSTGTPDATYTATGTLPSGVTLNGTTGVLSGTPTRAGSSTFTITAGNGTTPPDTATYTVVIRNPVVTTPRPVAAVPGGGTPAGVGSGSGTGGAGSAPELAFTGSNAAGPLAGAGILLAAGVALTVFTRRRRAVHRA